MHLEIKAFTDNDTNLLQPNLLLQSDIFKWNMVFNKDKIDENECINHNKSKNIIK